MIRITGGEFRGRSLVTAGLKQSTRPTGVKLRQACFNALQFQLPGALVLDLFAGSGALGLEALSRGAARAVFVEVEPSAVRCLQLNLQALQVEQQAKVLPVSVEQAWKRLAPEMPFQLIFADPPYQAGYELKLLEQIPWEQALAPQGLFCLEWSPKTARFQELPNEINGLEKTREKSYGESRLTFYKKTN